MLDYVCGEPPAQADERGGAMQRFGFEVTVFDGGGDVAPEAARVALERWVDDEWTSDGRRMDDSCGTFIVYMFHADLYAALLSMFRVRESLYGRLPNHEIRFRLIKDKAVA